MKKEVKSVKLYHSSKEFLAENSIILNPIPLAKNVIDDEGNYVLIAVVPLAGGTLMRFSSYTVDNILVGVEHQFIAGVYACQEDENLKNIALIENKNRLKNNALSPLLVEIEKKDDETNEVTTESHEEDELQNEETEYIQADTAVVIEEAYTITEDDDKPEIIETEKDEEIKEEPIIEPKPQVIEKKPIIKETEKDVPAHKHNIKASKSYEVPVRRVESVQPTPTSKKKAKKNNQIPTGPVTGGFDKELMLKMLMGKA